jgi:hypothetical protein
MSKKYEPSYKWNLSDLALVEKNGLKVFSCFACGAAPRWATSSPAST